MGRAAYIASSVAVLKMGIKLENVSSKYSTVKIIHNVSLNLDGRNIVLGPNGSGKTTLFRTILGLSVISEGRIIINGVSVEMLKGSPGLVVTNLEEVYGLLRVPVKGLAKFYLELCKGSLQFFLEMAREFELSNALSKRIDQLSAGQRKLVCNLIALSTGARHVLLDEPFENLDPAKRARIARVIIEKGETIIMNTHATWLLDKFPSWQVHLMFSGRVYGPLTVEELLGSSIVEGEVEDGLIRFQADGKTFSLVRGGEGIKLSSMESLDRLYEVGSL